MTRDDLLKNAKFWYDSYVKYRSTAEVMEGIGEEKVAAEMRQIAADLLDFHFSLVERIASECADA